MRRRIALMLAMLAACAPAAAADFRLLEIDGFELNVSCPNVRAGGMEFGADPDTLRDVVRGARAQTRLPLFTSIRANRM